MRSTLDDNRPIFQQIREMIEEDIVEGVLQEGEKAPSTNQLVAYYKINPSTVLKGVNELVDEGILFKKRGVGMFVAEGARGKLIDQRKQNFKEEFVYRMLQEANKLSISQQEIEKMMNELKGRNNDE
ncbi:GntR family transcriptional regulator [Alkalicoccobacillus murimartini]|uniref:DNA-binding transcriptional regulator YhcF (GntR family) n=1 Tax=Alkalicoccobacillus murimartini TaxID=171685 RepID=A0ABT9YKX4_9BACI|nr:GntR family transcriptional regulator [Alkalicoccobacillus murimartini]MDQ0208519.1 DNA-binding transcriptional regulator YhcF (GntR family) [Alkalicoccobacillus murimartini]